MRSFVFLIFFLGTVHVINAQLATRPVVYLNFSGGEVIGTPWNTEGPIQYLPYQISLAAKNEILRRVEEDFSIIDILITLDSVEFLQAPLNRRMELIITPTAWYPKGGGVAYVGSFNWADYTPAWVFPSRLGNNLRYIAEASSHEIGHVFGLHHQSVYDEDCVKLSEYYEGRGGNDPTAWAPIMGTSYQAGISTWYIGTSAEGCEFIQKDIEQMADQSLLTLLPDDYGNDYQQAYEISATAGEFGLRGLINHAFDEDVFKINLNKTTRLKLDALPFRVGSDPKGANVHLELHLTDGNKEASHIYKSLDKISAGIDTTLTAGVYYLTVTGADNRFMSREFSIGSYSLAGIITHSLPVTRLEINGMVENNRHQINWKFEADEAIESVTLQYSYDGSSFKELVKLPSTAKSYSWTPSLMSAIYYRVKVNTVNSANEAYSRIILLESQFDQLINITQDIHTKLVKLNLQTTAYYELYNTSGSLLKKQNLPSGEHHLDFRNLSGSVLLLKVFTKTEFRVHKIIP